MMNFDLAVMTVLYWDSFLEEQRDADIPTQSGLFFQKKINRGVGKTFLKTPLELLGF